MIIIIIIFIYIYSSMYERNGFRVKLRTSLTLHENHCVHTSMDVGKIKKILNKSVLPSRNSLK